MSNWSGTKAGHVQFATGRRFESLAGRCRLDGYPVHNRGAGDVLLLVDCLEVRARKTLIVNERLEALRGFE